MRAPRARRAAPRGADRPLRALRPDDDLDRAVLARPRAAAPRSRSVLPCPIPAPAPFRWQGEHIAAELPGARVLFSTRRGGVSAGPYASLNLGPADRRRRRQRRREPRPARRRRRASRASASSTAARSTARRCGARPAADRRGPPRRTARRPRSRDAAALVVRRRLPAGAARRRRRRWRRCTAAGAGSRRGIVAEGVAALRELGADGPRGRRDRPGRARLLLRGRRGGPRRVRRRARARARASATSTCPPSPATRWPQAGVGTIHDTGLCTICPATAFFSHRRDGGVTGRQAGVVWRA